MVSYFRVKSINLFLTWYQSQALVTFICEEKICKKNIANKRKEIKKMKKILCIKKEINMKKRENNIVVGDQHRIKPLKKKT